MLQVLLRSALLAARSSNSPGPLRSESLFTLRNLRSSPVPQALVFSRLVEGTKTKRQRFLPTIPATGIADMHLTLLLAVAVGALGCTTQEDCFMNGACSSGACLCDAPVRRLLLCVVVVPIQAASTVGSTASHNPGPLPPGPLQVAPRALSWYAAVGWATVQPAAIPARAKPSRLWHDSQRYQVCAILRVHLHSALRRLRAPPYVMVG